MEGLRDTLTALLSHTSSSLAAEFVAMKLICLLLRAS